MYREMMQEFNEYLIFESQYNISQLRVSNNQVAFNNYYPEEYFATIMFEN